MAATARHRRRRLARFHILGVTVAEHSDRSGGFTQIVYFTLQDPQMLVPPVVVTY